MRLLLLIAALLCFPVFADAPRVVKATPDNGESDVDPGLKQIVIVFDQPMDQRGRSIVGGGETFPKITGNVRWTNDRTIVIPVTLEPNHEYWLSINSETFRNFTSKQGESAVPYPIAFSTAGGERIAPDVQRESIRQLHQAIEDAYSYHDRLKIDWDRLFADHAARLEKCETARAFASEAGKMLAAAKDLHVFLKVGNATIGSFGRSIAPNVDLSLLPKIVPHWRDAGGIGIGRFDDGPTYLMIGAWSGELPDELFAAIAEADPARGMIIDVRANAGGDELLARQVAGCFITEPKVYSKNLNRAGGAWEGPFDRIVEPDKSRPGFGGKVVVLMGRYCMSSNESFILMMRSAGATLLGERTFGSSGNPKPHELVNGVIVFLPSWKDMLPDGTQIEGTGIAPDIEIRTTRAQFVKSDPLIDAARKRLRS